MLLTFGLRPSTWKPPHPAGGPSSSCDTAEETATEFVCALPIRPKAAYVCGGELDQPICLIPHSSLAMLMWYPSCFGVAGLHSPSLTCARAEMTESEANTAADADEAFPILDLD